MILKLVRRWIAPTLILLLSPTAYGNFIIDFEGLPAYEAIPQTHGDNSFFNVSYREISTFGNASTVSNTLWHWDTGYGDLVNVIWGGTFGGTTLAEIRFDSLTSSPIRLNSFDAAFWDSAANSQNFRVYDGNYDLLFALTDFNVTGVTRNSISPNVSANSLILQWDDPWNVAIDNISITAVPEPSSLMLVGVCAGLYTLRRRMWNNKVKQKTS